MSRPHSRPEMITSINVTPLVDVVLVLLIILMVTTGYIVSQAIPMQLPKAATGQSTASSLDVTIDRLGRIFIGGQPADLGILTERARALVRRSSDPRAAIAADGNVPHQRVVSVLDALQIGGIHQFAIQVQERDK